MAVEYATRGDLCEIHWVDINEEPTGDPTKATLAHRVSFGLFWEEREETGIPVIITTTTVDPADLQGQQGYCIYPKACIKSLKVIRKVRRPRVKKVANVPA